MLLPNRPSSFKAITSVGLICLFIFFTFNYFIWGSDRTFLPFSPPACVPSTVIIPSALEPAVTVTQTLPPLVAPSASPITITATAVQTQTETVVATPAHTATHTAIPEKLWYKLGPKGLSNDARGWIDSCLKKNPEFRHEFLTDASGDHYVQEYFAHRPELVDTYLQLNIPILKADFLRYLILFAEGGIWSDLDVSCEEVEIKKWIPDEHKKETAIVVGLEFDWKWEDDNFLHSQFASWMIMAKPNNLHMGVVIQDIIDGVRDKAKENNVKISELTTKMVGEVVDITGPKRMTRSIVKSLEGVLQTTIDDRNISQLREPRRFADVLILPGNSFAASQNGYPEDEGPKLVTHHYAGTWKNENGGEMAKRWFA